MSKRNGKADADQAVMDREDILAALTRWSEAREKVRQLEDDIAVTLGRVRLLKRQHQTARWDALTKWRALRRAQGYEVD